MPARGKVPGLERYLEGWQQYCQHPASAAEIETWAANADGVTVALGRGLVALDIDTDCPLVAKAIASILPPSPSGKRGMKGKTLFYRDPTGTIATRRFKHAVTRKNIVEVLARGAHTALPPTRHPDTGQPYAWIGTPLYDFHLDELPVVLPEHVAAIETALQPFLGREAPKEPMFQADQAQGRKHMNHHESGGGFVAWEGDPKQLADWVRRLLKAKTAELASTAGGRNSALFDLACQLGRYVHGNVIPAGELEGACRVAYAACGALDEHGEGKLKGTIESALKRTAADPLTIPDAIARKLRGERAVATGWAKFPNALANDIRLDAPALVVLAYRMTKPADWVLRERDLARIVKAEGRSGLGRDKARSTYVTLKKCGYIDRRQSIEKGRKQRLIERLTVETRTKSFAQIPAHIFDGTLTCGALAVVVFVAANNSVFGREVAERFGWHRETANKYIREAIDRRFVIEEATRRPNGTFERWKYKASIETTGDGFYRPHSKTFPLEIPVEGRKRQPPTELEDTGNVIHVNFGGRSNVF